MNLYWKIFLPLILLWISTNHADSHEFDKGLSAYFNYYEYDVARESFLIATNQGHSDAAFYLGEIFEGGFSVAIDYQQAFNWYSRAAKSNHAKAQIRLADMYLTGRAVKQDLIRAQYWYLKAAQQGSPLAQFRVARLYAKESDQTRSDSVQAYKWWTIAAWFGDPDALAERDIFAIQMKGAEISKAIRLAEKWEENFN